MATQAAVEVVLNQFVIVHTTRLVTHAINACLSTMTNLGVMVKQAMATPARCVIVMGTRNLATTTSLRIHFPIAMT